MAIVSYTSEQLKKMKSLTDWERVRNMKDEDIDFSDCPDITDLLKLGLIKEVESPLKNIKRKQKRGK